MVSLPSLRPESCCAEFRLALYVYIFPEGANTYGGKQVAEQKADETCFKKSAVFHFFHDRRYLMPDQRLYVPSHGFLPPRAGNKRQGELLLLRRTVK
jgi:hypothetical protein